MEVNYYITSEFEKYKKYAEMWHFTYLDEKNLL